MPPTCRPHIGSKRWEAEEALGTSSLCELSNPYAKPTQAPFSQAHSAWKKSQQWEAASRSMFWSVKMPKTTGNLLTGGKVEALKPVRPLSRLPEVFDVMLDPDEPVGAFHPAGGVERTTGRGMSKESPAGRIVRALAERQNRVGPPIVNV